MSDLCVREGCRNLGAALVQAGGSVAARESPRIAGSTLASAKVFQASVEASRRMQAAASLAQELQSLAPVKTRPVRWWNKVIWWLLARRPLRWFFIPGDDVVWTRDFSPTDADCPKSTGKVLFSSVHRFFGRSFVPLEQFEREQERCRAMQSWLGSLGLLKNSERTSRIRLYVNYLLGKELPPEERDVIEFDNLLVTLTRISQDEARKAEVIIIAVPQDADIGRGFIDRLAHWTRERHQVDLPPEERAPVLFLDEGATLSCLATEEIENAAAVILKCPDEYTEEANIKRVLSWQKSRNIEIPLLLLTGNGDLMPLGADSLQELGLQKVLVHPEEEEVPDEEPLDHVNVTQLLDLMQRFDVAAWTIEAWKESYDKRYGTHIDVGELAQVFKYLVANGHARPMGANQYQVVLRHKGSRA